jgi:hypothetical protein
VVAETPANRNDKWEVKEHMSSSSSTPPPIATRRGSSFGLPGWTVEEFDDVTPKLQACPRLYPETGDQAVDFFVKSLMEAQTKIAPAKGPDNVAEAKSVSQTIYDGMEAGGGEHGRFVKNYQRIFAIVSRACHMRYDVANPNVLATLKSVVSAMGSYEYRTIGTTIGSRDTSQSRGMAIPDFDSNPVTRK